MLHRVLYPKAHANEIEKRKKKNEKNVRGRHMSEKITVTMWRLPVDKVQMALVHIMSMVWRYVASSASESIEDVHQPGIAVKLVAVRGGSGSICAGMLRAASVCMGAINSDNPWPQHFVSQGTNVLSRSSTSNKNTFAFTFRTLRGDIATRRVLRGLGLEEFPY